MTMPELPEVETIRLQIQKNLVGKSILSIQVRTPNIVQGEYEKLKKKQIIKARRFSKMLVIDCTGNISVLIHLKMTGRLVYDTGEYSHLWDIQYPFDRHTHSIFKLNSGQNLYYNDYRRFGYIEIIQTSKVTQHKYIANLGKEFFRNLTHNDFWDIVHSKNRAIKSLLLDQSVLGGVGNIYANEALWISKIHPSAISKTLTKEQTFMLFQSLEKIMTEAIDYHGASSDNFRDLFGVPGSAQNYFSVYGKQGQSCSRCQGVIEKIYLGGRGTFICPFCQNKG